MMKKAIIWVLLITSGCILLHNQLEFQQFLAPGDHGRDLYAFEATMEGQMPYKDYWWVYGPLTPYYYSLFYRIFGVSIHSVFIGKFLLNLTAGAFFFLALSLLVPPIFAYIGTLWFWSFHPDFFFTYNHVAGIAGLLAFTYYILRYFRDKNLHSLYFALLSSFILMFIKVNFGMTSLVILILFTALSDWFHKTSLSKEKIHFYLIALIAIPLAVVVIYWAFLRTLPLYAIRQCLPYLSVDHPHNESFLTSFKIWWTAIAYNININWPNRLFAGILLLSIFKVLNKLHKEGLNAPRNKETALAILMFISFYFLNMHEFFVSAIIYRTFWAKLFSSLLVFLFIGTAMKSFPKRIQIMLAVILLSVIMTKYSDEAKRLQPLKSSNRYIELDRARVMTFNSDTWIQTVRETTAFLKSNLSAEEIFFAMPYDPLYYFLTGKPSPTRQTIFFEHINIPAEQEAKIINELEEKNVNFILLSNRSHSSEPGLGTFGKTYCPILAKYVLEHFTVIKEIGNWNVTPGWTENHAVRIYKRK